MGGCFQETVFNGQTIPKGSPEFNLSADVAAAQKLFTNWPTLVAASGLEIGLALLYPGRSIEHDYSYVDNHPIADTYRTYCEEQKAKGSMKEKCPHDHPTFDLTSVLYAARPHNNYFSLSKPGRIAVLADGGSRFDELEGGTQRYLILSQEQKGRALEAMVILATQPPREQ